MRNADCERLKVRPWDRNATQPDSNGQHVGAWWVRPWAIERVDPRVCVSARVCVRARVTCSHVQMCACLLACGACIPHQRCDPIAGQGRRSRQSQVVEVRGERSDGWRIEIPLNLCRGIEILNRQIRSPFDGSRNFRSATVDSWTNWHNTASDPSDTNGYHCILSIDGWLISEAKVAPQIARD